MIISIAERIKELRELSNLTQSQLAKQLDVTRSSVNAWEMGISIPSVSKLIELSSFFHVSTDYLLGLKKNKMICIDQFSSQEQSIICSLVEYFQASYEN